MIARYMYQIDYIPSFNLNYNIDVLCKHLRHHIRTYILVYGELYNKIVIVYACLPTLRLICNVAPMCSSQPGFNDMLQDSSVLLVRIPDFTNPRRVTRALLRMLSACRTPKTDRTHHCETIFWPGHKARAWSNEGHTEPHTCVRVCTWLTSHWLWLVQCKFTCKRARAHADGGKLATDLDVS